QSNLAATAGRTSAAQRAVPDAARASGPARALPDGGRGSGAHAFPGGGRASGPARALPGGGRASGPRRAAAREKIRAHVIDRLSTWMGGAAGIAFVALLVLFGRTLGSMTEAGGGWLLVS